MKALRKLLATTFKLALLVGLGVGGYYGYQQYAAEPEEEALGELPTVIAEVRDITVSVSATGVLQPVKIVEIKSKASGEILEMPVDLGDFVRAGELIAQIDTRILDQELKQVEADYESAKIRMEISANQYERAKSLHAQDLISQNDLETSEQNYSNSESQLIRAEASLELARERLEDTTVTAPITGTIIAKTVETGQIIASSTNNVSGGTTLIQMADLSELEIRTLVDEIDIGRVKPGLRVESTVEAFVDMEFEGAVIKIEPQAVVQQSVTTFPVLSRIDNTEGLLLPGMNADVQIIIHERFDVLTVSNEAVRTPDDAREIVSLLGIDARVAASTSMPVADAGAHDDATLAGDTVAASAHAADGGPMTSAADNGGSHDNGAAHDNGGSSNGAWGNGDAGNGSDNGGSAGLRGRGTGGADREAMRARLAASATGRGRPDGRIAADPSAEDEDDWGVDGERREPAVVFVVRADGSMATREILTGVRDWETTEVVRGLQAGEEVVVLPSTSLLRSQQRTRERFARRNTLLPGAGGR